MSPPSLPSLTGLVHQQQGLVFRLLDIHDMGAILQLRARVLQQLSHPDQYVREAQEELFVASHLRTVPQSPVQSWGASIGVFDQCQLVAYAMLGIPCGTDPDNLAHRVGKAVAIPEATAHLASCMVAPQYQGRHLQRSLLYIRQALAKAWGRSCLLAMVSLHNHASRHNLMNEGSNVVWLGEIEGLRRQLIACDLVQSRHFDRRVVRTVCSLDWQTQQRLLAAGWWGVRSVREQQGSKIEFARQLHPTHDKA